MEGASGRYSRSRPYAPSEPLADLAVDATLRAVARRRSRPWSISVDDLRKKVRFQLRRSLVVFLVDASESMGTRDRMTAARGAALALLATAYRNRDRVAVVAFCRCEAQVLLRPTSSIALARERLQALPTGGATPFADGLLKAWQLIRTERAKDRAVEPLLAILSDGEANVPLQPGRSVTRELHYLARSMRAEGIRAVIVDAKDGPQRERFMVSLAEVLGADYHHVDRPRASLLVGVLPGSV
ncbi:VWA domain-containing protein [Planctomycetota bacterium]